MQPDAAGPHLRPGGGHRRLPLQRLQYVLDTLRARTSTATRSGALREELVEGMELSPKVGRMCAMNLYLHGIGGDKVVVHTGHDSLAAPWSSEYSMVLANPPFGKKQSLLFVNEEGDTGEGRPGRRPRGLLDLDQQQAAQLRPAHLHAAEDRRPGGGGGAGQRALRGRRGREGAPQPAAEVPRPHPAASADRHLVFAGREGQRDLLRQEGGPRRSRGPTSSGSTTCAPTSTSR